jgi:hypothetical protein
VGLGWELVLGRTEREKEREWVMMRVEASVYLRQFGVGAWQQRAAEFLLGADGSREGWR